MSDAGREPAQNAGAAPGQRLKDERERRGISTQKVAEDLHVDPWIVEALEAGQFHALGAPVYAKGHLRKYAALLGLDGESLVAACNEHVQSPSLAPLKVARGTRQHWRLPGRTVGISATAVIVAVGAGWGYGEWRARSALKGGADAAPATEAKLQETVPDVTASSAPAERSGALATTRVQPMNPPRAEKVAATISQPSTASVEPRGYVRLRLSFVDDSWVEVYDAEQRRVFADLGTANTARSLTVNAPARIVLGRPESVQMEVNGQPVSLPASRGGVLRVTLDSQGRVRPAGRQPSR